MLGPLALSVFASRRLVNAVWAGLALCGVFLLGGGGFGGLDLVGAAFAVSAGGMWAAYIVFSARTGRRFPQADGLALAMAVAAVLCLPLGIAESGSKLVVPTTLALGAAVAVMSSVLPYTLELLALRRMPASTFAVMMSLEPAIAALAGFLILDQAMSALGALAIALVIAASIGAVRTQVGRGGRRFPRRTSDRAVRSDPPARRRPHERGERLRRDAEGAEAGGLGVAYGDGGGGLGDLDALTAGAAAVGRLTPLCVRQVWVEPHIVPPLRGRSVPPSPPRRVRRPEGDRNGVNSP